jgi:endonuclease G, mitochondrial
MLQEDIIRETERRFAMREAERLQTEAKLREGGVAAANSRELVVRRVRRVGEAPETAGPAMLGEAGIAAAEMAGDEPVIPRDAVLERILGENDLLGVAYLEIARRAARAICCVRIRERGRTIGSGTGFMVSPRLIMTNNHVLRSLDQARQSFIEFDYEDDPDGVRRRSVLFDLEPDLFFLTDPALDYTLVAAELVARDQQARLSDYGWLPLMEDDAKVLRGEPLNIIQHPNGAPKQLALRANDLIDIAEDFLHYHTDTAPGSSGSPVFNDQWEVVALHHSGVPRRDGQGRILARGGGLWSAFMGDERIDWIANEGARVSRLVTHIAAQPMDGDAAVLRQELLAFADSRHAVTPAAPPSEPAPSLNPELQAALQELATASTRPYYDGATDLEAQSDYYTRIMACDDPDEMFRALHALVDPAQHRMPRYAPGKRLYPWIELQPNLKIRSIYSSLEFEPQELIVQDFQAQEQRATEVHRLMLREAALNADELARELDALEATAPFNCEHVVCQSWFGKVEPMKGDLHHLFACEWGCNSFRNNTPYFDFPDFLEVIRDDCGKSEGERFEPGASKGKVARATLYFLLAYPGKVNSIRPIYDEERIATLLAWHESFPVDLHEQHRNQAIFAVQGNRNPLIDHPEWAGRINFRLGL